MPTGTRKRLRPRSARATAGRWNYGIAITSSNVANWQRSIGYVPQHIYLSDDTIARNIAFGEQEPDTDGVMWAARAANAQELAVTDREVLAMLRDASKAVNKELADLVATLRTLPQLQERIDLGGEQDEV